MASGIPPTVSVLVVEDEPLILMDAVDFLEDAGFKVYFSEDADKAVRLLEAFPDIRVLFTDIDMPGSMDGLALSHAVRRRWPPLHIIVTSGHRRVGQGDLPPRGVFLPKPYHHARVVEHIHRLVQ